MDNVSVRDDLALLSAHAPMYDLEKPERRAMNVTTVYDCMGSNLGKFSVPHGVLLAGYTTGSGGVPWTPAQLAAHPDAVLIDQSPENTPADELADVLDVEQYAATLADIPEWVHAARTAYALGTRPGQRAPTIYCNQSTLTPVANTLVAAGIASGVNLWLAAEMTSADATAKVLAASGPYPIVGIQYAFLPDHDVSVFSNAWLNKRSVKPNTPPSDQRYTVQIEHYEDGFGWVLDTHFTTPPATRYRARISDGQWSDWMEFHP